MQSISFIGAGRLAQTLATALTRAGWSVTTVASRSDASAEQLSSRLPSCRAVDMQEAATADIVFLSVPDDQIAATARVLSWRAGQAVLHCSGATDIAALTPAQEMGAWIGGFHPLQIFSDPELAIQHLPGSFVAIEASEPLLTTLKQMAESLSMKVITLPSGGRALYHAGANYAASMLLPLLFEAIELWRSIGIDEKQALSALMPLAEGTLGAAQYKGIAKALSGPVSRGDVGVIQAHVSALTQLGEDHLGIYRTLTDRQIDLATQTHTLSPTQAALIRSVLNRLGPPLVDTSDNTSERQIASPNALSRL